MKKWANLYSLMPFSLQRVHQGDEVEDAVVEEGVGVEEVLLIFDDSLT